MTTRCPACGARIAWRFQERVVEPMRLQERVGDRRRFRFLELYECGAAYRWGHEPLWVLRCPDSPAEVQP